MTFLHDFMFCTSLSRRSRNSFCAFRNSIDATSSCKSVSKAVRSFITGGDVDVRNLCFLDFIGRFIHIIEMVSFPSGSRNEILNSVDKGL